MSQERTRHILAQLWTKEADQGILNIVRERFVTFDLNELIHDVLLFPVF